MDAGAGQHLRLGRASILGEMTVVASTNVTAETVIAVDAEDFVAAMGSRSSIPSGEAILHMEDTIARADHDGRRSRQPSERIMFQTAQIAVRMMMDVHMGHAPNGHGAVRSCRDLGMMKGLHPMAETNLRQADLQKSHDAARKSNEERRKAAADEARKNTELARKDRKRPSPSRAP